MTVWCSGSNFGMAYRAYSKAKLRLVGFSLTLEGIANAPSAAPGFLTAELPHFPRRHCHVLNNRQKRRKTQSIGHKCRALTGVEY